MLLAAEADTNPQRKRGTELTPSLALRVSVSPTSVPYSVAWRILTSPQAEPRKAHFYRGTSLGGRTTPSSS